MPTKAIPKLKQFAQRLLAEEVAAGRRTNQNGSPFRLCEKLRQPLSQLVGAAGIRALFLRALALASSEVPGLRTLHIKADCSWEDLGTLETSLNPKEIALGEVVFAARVLELLVTFIGPTLTLQLIRKSCPEAELSDLEF